MSIKKIVTVCLFSVMSSFANPVYETYKQFLDDYVSKNKITHASAFNIDKIDDTFTVNASGQSTSPVALVQNYFIFSEPQRRLELFQFVFEPHLQGFILSSYIHYIYSIKFNVPSAYQDEQNYLKFNTFDEQSLELTDYDIYPVSDSSEAINDYLQTGEIQDLFYQDFQNNYLQDLRKI